MKKRNKSYKTKQTSVPMLINRLVHKNVETLEENAMITAFKYGAATKDNYDYLVRMANMMDIALQTKPSEFALLLASRLRYLSKQILGRYQKTNKFGLNAEELKLMRVIVEDYDNYWKRQTTTLYNICVEELNLFYADLAEKRAE